MSTVDQRAQDFYRFLLRHQGQKFTLAELLGRTGYQPGAKSTAAIRRARDLATENGLHFPPAVPQNGYTYSITEEPEWAYEPAMQMDRIAAGVQRRADVGFDFIERHQGEIPPDMRPAVMGIVRVRQEVQRSAAALRRVYEDMLADTAKARRQARRDEENQ